MKNKFEVLYLLVMIGLFSMMIYSCSKDHDPLPNQSIAFSVDYSVSNRSVQSTQSNDGEVKMEFGRQMNNPYTVQNMTTAYNNIYNLSVNSLTATHRYVKFLPDEGDHLALLDDWERENLTPVFNFPLDYEITTPGDTYYDPSAPDPMFTYRYASVPTGMALPNVPNTIISDLFIPPYSSYLTEQAFYHVNEEFDGNNDRVEGNPPGDLYPADPCNPDCGDYPCCKLPWYDCGSNPCNPVLPPDCYPGSTNWPDCLDLDFPPVDPNDYPPPPLPTEYCECSEYERGQLVYTYKVKLNPGETCDDLEESYGLLDIRCGESVPPVISGGNGAGGGLNACGCPIPSSPRRPAGCVQVETDGSWAEVMKVMIKTRDNWFSGDITFTDAKGCWSINKKYSKRWTWVWVKFQNPNAKVRAVRANRFHKALVVADDYVDLYRNQPFNNFLVRYDAANTDGDGLARMYWACAQMINADFEYRSASSGLGIPAPRSGINYLLRSGDFLAGAPMLQGILGNGAISGPGASIAFVINTFLGNINIGGTILPFTISLSSALSPDIVRGYTSGVTAAEFRTTNMHELGHASHFSLVGESYWVPYRTHIVSNDLSGNGVYGSFGNFSSNSDPGRVALGEAIGSYTENIIGRSAPLENDTWQDNFIPNGLMYDLQDGLSSTDIITDPNDGSATTDIIQGFTPEMIFDALNQNTISIRSYRDRLRTRSLNSTPNSISTYNNFVDVYDVFN